MTPLVLPSVAVLAFRARLAEFLSGLGELTLPTSSAGLSTT